MVSMKKKLKVILLLHNLKRRLERLGLGKKSEPLLQYVSFCAIKFVKLCTITTRQEFS